LKEIEPLLFVPRSRRSSGMATTNPSDNGIAEAYKTFPFATDQEYQMGLQNILSSDAFNSKPNPEKENTLRLSRVFYFNKATGNSIALEDALNFESPASPVGGGEQQQLVVEGEGRILTFAELKALIEQGKTDGIPNNKAIPNVLNDAPPSENAGQIRKKPWET